jgi:ethanolamine ammonia-lyase small subunit
MMAAKDEDVHISVAWPEIVRQVRLRTPARLLVGRAGASYRTDTQMELREAHASARDAVRDELDMESTFGAAFSQRWGLFEVPTRAASKDEYLLRPDLGRHFTESARTVIMQRCSKGNDLQFAIGDGLSVPAVAAQVPALLSRLRELASGRNWSVGQTFVIRHCRVGILNEIGAALDSQIVVLLIGERPGLATTVSLSAYMAFRPDAAHTDANRNLVSNIHARGLSTDQAAEQIVHLAERMMAARTSGCKLPV